MLSSASNSSSHKQLQREALTTCSHDLKAYTCPLNLQKKSQENINSRLQLVMKSGKYTLGYKTCLKTLRSGKGEHMGHAYIVLTSTSQQLAPLCISGRGGGSRGGGSIGNSDVEWAAEQQTATVVHSGSFEAYGGMLGAARASVILANTTSWPGTKLVIAAFLCELQPSW